MSERNANREIIELVDEIVTDLINALPVSKGSKIKTKIDLIRLMHVIANQTKNDQDFSGALDEYYELIKRESM